MSEGIESTTPAFLRTLKLVALSILSTITVLVLIVIVTINTIPRSWVCGEHDVIEESFSPNGRYKAISFLSSCGATTTFTVNVSVIKAEVDLSSNQLGNVFRGPRGSTDVKIEWESDSSLMISYPSYYVDNQTMKPEHLGIRVNYQEYTP